VKEARDRGETGRAYIREPRGIAGQTRAILDGLRFVAEAKKSFDSVPSWTEVPSRLSSRQSLVVALRLDGVLRGGASLRIVTPTDAWEEDVYGQIEVRLPGVTRALRLHPIEWKPLRHHDNPPDAPPAHRNQRLWDRHYPFELNAPFGLGAFDQSTSGIATELPRAPSNFKEYTDLCSDLWICPDLLGLPPPRWTRTML
jgi:hypothetical protein